MNLLRHAAGSLIIFAIIVVLFTNLHTGIQEGYDVESTYNRTSNRSQQSLNIGDRMGEILIVSGIRNSTAGVYSLAQPSGITDIIGGFMGVALGIVKILGGIITFPFEIVGIIGDYYGSYIPVIILDGIIALIEIYIAFLILSAYLRQDV